MGPVIQSGSGVFSGSVRSKAAIGISRQLYSKWVLRDPGSFCAMVQSSSHLASKPTLAVYNKLGEEAQPRDSMRGGLGVVPISGRELSRKCSPAVCWGRGGTSRTPLPLLSALNLSGFSVSIYMPTFFMSDPGESRR